MTTTPRSTRDTVALLWRLTWPIAITANLVGFAEALIIYWLGHLVGPGALAVEATLRPALMCVSWCLLAVAAGVSVLVAQSVGARDGRGLSHVENGMGLLVVMWGVLAVIVLPFSGPLSEALSSASVPADDLRRLGLPALLLSLPGLAVLQVLLYAASGAGWTRLSLVRMVIDLAVTAVLVPVFIHVLGLGLSGAPIGQAASQAVMIVVVWRTLNKRRERLHLGGPPARAPWWDRRGWMQIMDIGLPPQLARIAMFVAYTYLLQRVARDGRADVVGFGLGLTILYFAINLSGAVGRATAIALGQAVGARDPARGRHVLRIGFVMGTGIGVVVLAALIVFAPQLVGLFVDDPAMVSRGVRALRILAYSAPFVGISQLLLFAFTAVKASKRAGVIGIVAEVIGVVFILVWPGGQLVGAAWSIGLSNATRAVGFAILGRGVLGRVLAPPPAV